MKVAVVTGGGSGIGAAAATALVDAGWRVVLAGRSSATLAAVAATRPGRMDPVPTDVTDEASVQALFAGILERHGRVDLLFNNAGRGSFEQPLDEVSLADWQAVVDVNLTGVFLCSREAFRAMRRQTPSGGRIINNGSISAVTPRPRSAPYAASKHAVTGLTKATALDGRPFGIACGQIDIGNAATDMTTAMADGILQADGSRRPEPRMGLEDVGRAVVYMASLPPGANVATMTVMATTMPFVGRG